MPASSPEEYETLLSENGFALGRAAPARSRMRRVERSGWRVSTTSRSHGKAAAGVPPRPRWRDQTLFHALAVGRRLAVLVEILVALLALIAASGLLLLARRGLLVSCPSCLSRRVLASLLLAGLRPAWPTASVVRAACPGQLLLILLTLVELPERRFVALRVLAFRPGSLVNSPMTHPSLPKTAAAPCRRSPGRKNTDEQRGSGAFRRRAP